MPRDSGPQHEQDTRDDAPGFGRLAAGELDMAIATLRGEERLQPLPKAFGENRAGHEQDLLWQRASCSQTRVSRADWKFNFARGSRIKGGALKPECRIESAPPA